MFVQFRVFACFLGVIDQILMSYGQRGLCNFWSRNSNCHNTMANALYKQHRKKHHTCECTSTNLGNPSMAPSAVVDSEAGKVATCCECCMRTGIPLTVSARTYSHGPVVEHGLDTCVLKYGPDQFTCASRTSMGMIKEPQALGMCVAHANT